MELWRDDRKSDRVVDKSVLDSFYVTLSGLTTRGLSRLSRDIYYYVDSGETKKKRPELVLRKDRIKVSIT